MNNILPISFFTKHSKKMSLSKVYFLFLLSTALCLFSTMMYMSSICYQNKASTKQSLVFNREVIIETEVNPAKVKVEKGQNVNKEEMPNSCNCSKRLRGKKDYNNDNTTPIMLSYTRKVASSNTSDQTGNYQTNHGTKLHQKCKVHSNNLIGRFNITKHVTANDVTNNKNNSQVKYGGVFKPSDCEPEQSVAIIIPYRDREEHLNTLINLLHNMLQRQKLHYGIYVVEMALPVQFNRGLLANAGFLTSNSIFNYTCYIIHDVDLLPLNDHNFYQCGSSQRHLSASNSKFPTGLPYPEYIGGVIAFSYEQFIKVNGFSNLFFGWGGEDDDLYKRMDSSYLKIERPPAHIGTYLALPHSMDSSNPPNPYKDILMAQSALRKDSDGLTSVRFGRKALEFRPLYIHGF